MGKLPASRVAAWLRDPDPKTRAVLLYGPDPTLVADRMSGMVARLLGGTDDPFRLARLSGDQVRRDPALLSDELNAISFGGGDRVVTLTEATDGTAGAVRDALAAMKGGAVLLIAAGGLAAGSKLRKLIEGEAAAMALPCYPPEGAALEGAVIDALHALDAPPLDGEARRALGAALSGVQHAEALRFAEKLALYVHGAPAITAEDVAECAPPAPEAAFDEAIQAVAQGRVRALPALFDRLSAQGESLPGFVRVLALYFQRLHRAQALMAEEGLDPGAAMGKLRPPVFFKLRDAFAAQLRAWPRAGVEGALGQLYALEAALRAGGRPPERALIERAAMRIAMSAPGARR